MKVIEKISQCYGCGACKNICPFQAIEMEEDENGFLRVQVDKEKCKDCSKCLQVCPRLKHEFNNNTTPECIAAWAKDEIRSQSASGGVFHAIAQMILDNGGWISGAVWDSDFRVKHILTNTQEGLKDIINSKYTQSNIKNVYREILKKLQEEETVLFCGCPCQVAGLYAFLGHDYDKLYTIDLICHGVPSQKVLKKYLKDCQDYDNVDRVDFRDKTVFGWSTEMNIYFKNDAETFRQRARENPFYNAFLWNMCLNPTCESCQFSRIPRQGDISLGDFWNIEKYDTKLNDGKGTSLVLLNNEKGKCLFDSCDYINKKEVVPLEFINQTCNSTVFKPFKHHYGRDRFFREFMRYDFSKAVKDCASFHYDVGLVTTWFARNYGAIFTAYALYKKLEELGYSVLMINKPSELWGRDYLSPNRNKMSVEFGRRHYNISKEYSISEEPRLDILNNNCSNFLLGSDQLWNPKVYAYLFYFFLDFVDWKHKKLSYATSIGADHFEGTEEDRAQIKYLLSRFDRISVREDEAVKICKDEFNVEATQVLEPVFLLDQDVYEQLAFTVKKDKTEDFIFVYILDGNLEKKKFVQQIADMYELPVLCAYDIEMPESSKRYMQFADANIKSPEEWLWYIKNSRLVITDSYHGTCFSIIFQKQFIGIANELRGAGRFRELFTRLQLKDVLFFKDDLENLDRINLNIQSIDYGKVVPIIEQERKCSVKWLIESIEFRDHLKICPEEYIYERINQSQKKAEKYSQNLNNEIKSLRCEMNDLESKINNMEKETLPCRDLLDDRHMFTDISQLGLRTGCAIQEIVDKLPNNSYFQQVQGAMGEPICDTPVPYGVLTIKKTTDYFVDVQFSQMTFANRVPQFWIAHVVNKKLVGWERLISENEFKKDIQNINEQCELYKNRIEELEKDIRLLIDSKCTIT